ncbi:divalent-cation tolerance protein CutA [Bremerella cremea]|uniref:Divalent-cation tolerance protein CutA n=1 Tax=Blastopirellula marina TaxID=124 RepID=A0A2S8G5G7_9BACT|nr:MULTISPECIES: divalent-cation tolerance protein CutA [Pirellulaceae]PQO39688.1 divalent-cation tolerance protein CutA [Blastopirellula marina]RCS51155.1 divalent-cation tolerance protein CutA [Bremerella cremea]
MSQVIVVQTTTNSRADAERLAEIVVQRALAGCVQITGPIISVYRWQDAVQKDEEYLLSIKTIEQAFTPLADLIRKHHSYDVPEIIALPITNGTTDYLAWLADQVTTE